MEVWVKKTVGVYPRHDCKTVHSRRSFSSKAGAYTRASVRLFAAHNSPQNSEPLDKETKPGTGFTNTISSLSRCYWKAILAHDFWLAGGHATSQSEAIL